MRTRSMQICRATVNALNEDIIKGQLDRMIKVGIGKTFSGYGWRCCNQKVEHSEKDRAHHYAVSLSFAKRQERERDNSDDVFDTQFEDIVRRVVSHGRTMGWSPCDEQSTPQASAAIEAAEVKQNFEAIALPTEYSRFFDHIYDRESQIRVIYQAIQSARESNFNTRSHCLCWGRASCGKTEVLLAFERMMGAEGVMKFDATMLTKAGAENELLKEGVPVPPILIIEEMEKCNPVNLPWLLGVLDVRGEILKTNARIGCKRKDAKCLCLATVNDMKTFQSIMSGALASRFSHKIYFPRPSRVVLQKILEREVKKMQGRMEWIEPALEYCMEVEKTDDPRRVKAVLDGRDRLLTGEYQADLRKMHEAMLADGYSVNSDGTVGSPG